MREYIVAVAGQLRVQRGSKPSKEVWEGWLELSIRFLRRDPSFNEIEFRKLVDRK